MSETIHYFFSTLTPSTDTTQNLQKVICPVFLAAGVDDYDCCPIFWKTVPQLPPRMTISMFEKSGHWPHYEEANLFDERIAQWLTQL